MRFSIEKAVLELAPSLRMAVLTMEGIHNGKGHEKIGTELKQAETDLRTHWGHIPAGQHPHVLPWREIYRAFGAKASRYPCSLEALIKRVLKCDPLPRIHNLVDLYNLVSIRHRIPIGGDDLERISGNLTLTRAEGGETFVPLRGGEEEVVPVGEVIYRDEEGVLCRRWNWREAERTQLREDTQKAVLFIEALEPVSDQQLQEAADDLAALAEAVCCCQVRISYLDLQTSEMELQ